MEPAPRPRVLFLDDDPGLRTRFERFFEGQCEPVVAATVPEALVLLRERRPCVAVLGVEVADMPGQSLLQRIRERHPDLPVIVTSKAPDAEVAFRSLGLPFDRLLPKPLDFHELAAVIDAIA